MPPNAHCTITLGLRWQLSRLQWATRATSAESQGLQRPQTATRARGSSSPSPANNDTLEILVPPTGSIGDDVLELSDRCQRRRERETVRRPPTIQMSQQHSQQGGSRDRYGASSATSSGAYGMPSVPGLCRMSSPPYEAADTGSTLVDDVLELSHRGSSRQARGSGGARGSFRSRYMFGSSVLQGTLRGADHEARRNYSQARDPQATDGARSSATTVNPFTGIDSISEDMSALSSRRGPRRFRHSSVSSPSQTPLTSRGRGVDNGILVSSERLTTSFTFVNARILRRRSQQAPAVSCLWRSEIADDVMALHGSQA